MAESYISELGDSLSHGVANTNGDRVKIIAPKLYNDGNGNHPSIATALAGKSSTSHTHTTSIASDSSSGTVVTLAHNTQYKLTAGGTSVLFKTPADSNTDTKVTQTVDTSNDAAYPLLAKNTTATATITDTSRFTSGVTLNPKNKSITATTFIGELSGNATTATTASKLGTSNVGSDIRPIYLSSGTPTGIYYSTWKNRREDSLNALGPMWYVTEGAFDVATDGNVRYVALAMPSQVSSAEMALMGWRSNSPFLLHIQLFNFTYSGNAEIIIKECNGYPAAHISKIITRWSTTSNTYTVYFEIGATATSFRWRSTSADITSERFSILTKAEYDAITTNIYASVDVNRDRSISTSKRNVQRGKYDVLDVGDVVSSYDATGTAPVNGTAVASAISGKVSKTGDTMSGSLTISTASGFSGVSINRSDTGTALSIGVSSGDGTTHGIYSGVNSNWMINATSGGIVKINHNKAGTNTYIGNTNVGATNKPMYLASGKISEGSLYAGGTAVTLNGTSQGASTASFYAPTGAGTNNYVLKSNGSGAPTWVEKAPKATVADTATKVSTTEDTTNYLYILGVDSTDSNFNVIKRDTRLAAYGGKLMFTENSKGNYLGISGGQDSSSVYSYLPPSGGTMIAVNSQTEINMAITDNYNKVEFNVRKYAGTFAARETPIDDYYFYRGLATTYNPDNNIESNIHAGKYTLSEKCTLQFNTTTNALDFVFA